MTGLRHILLAEDNANDVELTLTALRENHVANEVIVVREDENALRIRAELINLCAIWALHNIRDKYPCSYKLIFE